MLHVVTFGSNTIYAFVLAIYFIGAIYSVVYSFRRLRRPGVRADIRNFVITNHFWFVVFIIVIQVMFSLSNFTYIFNYNSTQPGMDASVNSVIFQMAAFVTSASMSSKVWVGVCARVRACVCV